MIRQRSWVALALLVPAVLAAGGCSRPRPIVVGSKGSTEQTLLGEIVAQHLENRLGQKIQRHLSLGGTLIAFQALQSGEIGLYPEYTGAIETEILKEQPSGDSSLVFERARGEMRRVAQSELLDPLGIDNRFVAVIRSDDPRAAKVSTLSEAVEVTSAWKVGVSYDFQQRTDGLPLLSQYRLPMLASVRSLEPELVFKTAEQGQVTLIAANATDAPLDLKEWKVLRDDRNVFPPYQACLLVKQGVLAAEPRLKPALAELSGKFTTEKMRHLNAQVDLYHRPAAEVAAMFLAQAGLK
ncbi:MAG TPA: glycine betaine ABC transporter substrate-binding protein [Bryobacteraceae bacterium]|jgi:osmoprotectant transport system substrate-binding protein|nr:glycine betaine ABC transporter substrate-binding protein [Bryobacteraceae bacterium]